MTAVSDLYNAAQLLEDVLNGNDAANELVSSLRRTAMRIQNSPCQRKLEQARLALSENNLRALALVLDVPVVVQ